MSTGSLPPLDILGLLPGAQPDPGADPLEFLYGLPPPQLAMPTEPGLPPAPPAYTAPDMLPVPQLGFMDRFSTALAGVPRFNGAMPMEGPGQAFARGLIGGVAGGISSAGAERMKRAEQERVETNATRKSEADRNYVAAMETWRQKLTRYYKTQSDKDGKVKITEQMATDLRLPKGSAGTYEEPLKLAQRISTVREEDRKRAEDTASTINDPAMANYLKVPVGTQTSIPNVISAQNSMKPPGSGSGGMYGSLSEFMDPEAVADKIVAGTESPILTEYGRPFNSAVASVLAKKYPKYDRNRAQMDFKSIMRRFLSLNTGPQVRFQQAIANVDLTVNQLNEYLNTAEALGAKYGLRSMNKLVEKLNKEGMAAFGGDAASREAVQRIQSLGTTLLFELAVMYQGGGVPTEKALQEADRIIDPSADISRLRTQLEVAKRESGMRLQAIRQAGAVSPSNPAGTNAELFQFIGMTPMEYGSVSETPAPVVENGSIKMLGPGATKPKMVPIDQYREAVRRGWTVAQ